MNKIEIELFIVAIFALFALIAVPSVSAVPCNCGDICVNETGWWCDGGAFNPSDTLIQDAIDNATAGDTICVKDGTYTENVDVKKRLTIQSENGADYTTVQAASSSDHVFKVTADYVTISGFSVTGATGSWDAAGIYLNDSADHCNISANAATNNEYGIYLRESSNNNLTKNTVNSNNQRGIDLHSSSKNTIANSTVSNNIGGISLWESSNNTLTSNTVSNNDWDGIHLSSSSNNTLTGNTVSNNEYGIYLYSQWWAPSSNNLIYNNYFDNTNNAFDNGNNVWNITKTAGSNIIGGSWLGGNYWSDYDGFDANGDGLGDTLLPYNSNGNIISGGDWHPLVPAGIAPILSIEKSDDPDHVLPGDTINYSIILTNTGYINATNVTVTETYDVNVTFVSAVPAPYEGNDTWIFPSLDVSATKRINISVTVNPSIPMGTYLHNIVKVTCDEGVTDSDTEDTIVSSEHNCTCGDICVNTTGWWRDGGAFYPSDTPIQDAIDNASAGDTICVKDGEYNENVDVDKRLAIKSENGAASTTVNALDSNDHVFGVTADYVTISGFMVKGADSPRARIFLVGVAHCNISDNIANSINGAGIRLRQSSNNILAGNTANSNNDDGILLWLEGSNSNTLIGNTANNGYYGLFLLSSCSNTFIGNTVNSNSGDGIRVELNSDSNTFIGNTASSNRENGIYLTKSSNDNTLSGNTANWNYECGIRLYSSCNTLSDNIASNNCDGIVLQGSSNNTLAGNTANSNNGCGILLDHWGYVLFSSNNTLAGNTANSNFHGISLGSSHSNTLSSNTANSNNECGILLRGGWFNTLKNNTASNNSDGIFLYARYNTLTGNTVSNNDAGIHLEGRSRNNTITSNTASSNNYGVYLISSGNGGNNLIYNNYFNNTNNAWDDGNNIWNITKTAGPNIIGGSWLGGNYWSDYDGIDGNGDGLGDTLLPYNSLGNILQGGDWHPLVEVSLPDLVITEKWLCWPDNCTICYNVTNIGDGTAPACHNTALYVDGVVVAHDHVPEDLASGESYTGCFNGYVWGYTPPSDEIKVCADYNEAIDELDEDNNCLPDIWMCGDVNCDGKVTMSDVRKVFNRYLDPNYPLDLPWAADVNCDGKVTMSDVRKVFNRYLDPSYGLNCCCRV